MFGFTEDMTEKQELVRKFCEEWIYPNLAEIDAGTCCPDYIWEEWCKIPGFASPCAPKFTGGEEMPFNTCLAMWEEFGKADVGVATGFGSNNLGSFPILLTGTEEQQKEHFGNLLKGKFGAFGLTEKGAGSDAGAVATEARKEGEYYILNGDKCYITTSGKAIESKSTLAICASTDKSLGSKGLTMFLIPGDTPGLTAVKEEDKMGIRGSATYELIFTDCRIPKENMLGKQGEGFKIAMHTLDGGRIGIAAQALGLAEGALERTIEYVKERKQFGRAIGQFQNTQFQLADMATKVQAAQYMVYRAAVAKATQKTYSVEAAMAKLYAAEVAMEVTTKAVQLHGGYGYIREYDVERMMRDAKITEIYEGTSEVQRMVISSALLK